MHSWRGKAGLFVLVSLAVALGNTALVAATNAGISFVVPVGGEKWELNESRGIFWICTADAGPNVRIVLLQNGLGVRTIAESVPARALANNQGYYKWDIPGNVTDGSNYQIRIESLTNSSVSAVSNAFSIQYVKPFIRFDNPTAGATLNVGILYPLRWSYHGYKWSAMTIFLNRRSGGQKWTVASAIPIGQNDQGSFSWKIPSDIPSGGDYYLTFNMASIRGWDAYGDTGNFSVLNSSGDFLLLTAPVQNVQWRVGETHAITWKYPPHLNFKVNVLYEIEGDTSATKYHQIAWELPVGSNGQGSYTWALPVNLVPGNYIMSIIGNGNNLKDSQKFSVAAAEYIRLLSPRAGEAYENGRPIRVLWEFSGAPGPNVGVILRNLSNGAARVIGTNVPLAGKVFNWTIPANEPSGQYRISVQSGDKTSYQATSDSFQIVKPLSVGMTAPAVNSYWSLGANCPIAWNYHVNTATAVAGINLLKGGKVLMRIAGSVALPQTQESSTYNWVIPQNLETGGDYQIQIAVQDGLALASNTGPAFSIGPELRKIEAPKPFVPSPGIAPR